MTNPRPAQVAEGSARPCEATVAEFVFGPQRCHQPSVTEAVDQTWGSSHPVCAEHAPTPTHRPARATTPQEGHQ